MKVIFFANTDWYLYNFRLGFAKYLRERGFEVVMVSPDGEYRQLIEAQGFRWIGVTMDRLSLHPTREWSVLRQINRVYASEKPDIVHHFTLKCVVYGSFVAALRGIRNRVNAIEGMGYVFASTDWKALALRPVVKGLVKCAVRGKNARVTFLNFHDLEDFDGNRKKPRENVRMILGAGIDTTMFQPNERHPSDGVTKALFAGRLLWDKGLREYVEAARVLREANVTVKFLMAGRPDPGNPASVSMEDVEKWQASGYIEYLGHVNDMPSLLASVDMVVLPSYREGAPRILIEAAAAGLPIVATDVPGCKDIVQHGGNGLLVPVRQVDPLARAIRRLHENAAERRRMGLCGREKALQEFDDAVVFEETFAVYKELISSDRAA